MDNGKIRILLLTGLTACLSFLLSNAQPVIKTSIDKSEILIGDQFKLRIETSFPGEAYRVNWPLIPDSLPHFEVVGRSSLDTVYNNSNLTGFVQTITLTSFDSGKWVLPSFPVSIFPVTKDTALNFLTDPVPVTVSFSASDTTSQLRDIKPIMEVETSNPVWYYIVAGIFLVLLVIFFTWFFKYRRKKQPPVPFRAKASPFDEAMEALENLKSYNLTVPGEIKIVHTKLAEILKRYISRRQNNNYLNHTTGEMLILLSAQSQDKSVVAKAAASLRCSDAVKFAKYLPPSNESEICLGSVKEIIYEIHQSPIAKP